MIKLKKAKKTSGLARTGLIPAVVIGNLFTSGLEKITKKKYGRTTTKELATTGAGKVLGLATLGTGLALGIATGKAGTIVSKLTPKQKIVGLVGAGLISSSPLVSRAVTNAPGFLVDRGIKLGQKIEALPTEQTKDKGTLGLILAGLGIGIAGAGAGALINKAKNKAGGLIDTLPIIDSGTLPTEIETEAPISDISEKPKRRYKKKKKTALDGFRQTIRQHVDVRVNAGNKKYLKMVQYN